MSVVYLEGISTDDKCIVIFAPEAVQFTMNF